MKYKRFLLALFGLVTVAALACSSAANPPAAAPASEPPANSAPSSQPTEEVVETPGVTPSTADIPTPVPTAAQTPEEEPRTPPSLPSIDERDARMISGLERTGWATDFSKKSVPLTEIMSGGPPRDGIPPIDDPEYASVANPPEYMNGKEPVVALEIDGDARAYPLAILIWHEIVNDEVGGVPVTVTYCPLCNTAITFDRRVGDQVLDFGIFRVVWRASP